MIVAIANQKGGVGKTTTAVNLSASLALGGKGILLVDSDPQCNTTSGLGFPKDLEKNLYTVYTGAVAVDDAIVETDVDNLFLLPSSVDLLGVEVELVNRSDRESVLKEILRPLRQSYEYIFIDCPPSLGLLTLNALVAAEYVLIPVQCEYYALEGLSLLMNTLNMIKRSFNPTLEIGGVLLTMFDVRTSISKQVEREVRDFFGQRVFRTVIPRNVTLSEAPSFGKPVMLYDARSKGAESYLQLAKEMINENSSW